MDGIALAERLLKNIREKREDYKQMLADGKAEKIEDSRVLVGQIRGLTYCEEEIRTSMKGIEDD